MKDWDEFDYWLHEAVIHGSAVIEIAFLFDYELELGKWHRSQEKRSFASGESPFTSYLLNKKWTLEEEFNNHMMRFQQVTVNSIYYIKIIFYIPGWIDNH